MKVADLLESRMANWQELEEYCRRVGPMRGRPSALTVTRFARLYRAACADLALADAYQLPPETIGYLHELVGRAHNQLYRSRNLRVRRWLNVLLVDVPRRLFADVYLRLAVCVFWGIFILATYLGYAHPGFADRLAGTEALSSMERMYSEAHHGRSGSASAAMAGFYAWHNPDIGLRCFAFGLLLGVGGLYETIFNAAMLGAVFGHMATVPQRDNFFEFVTAHGPFELTAVVLCAAAGMRLGFSLVATGGLTRGAALRKAGGEAMPIAGAALVLFVLAALIEAFISPSAAPYAVKAGVAVASTILMLGYYFILGTRGPKLKAES